MTAGRRASESSRPRASGTVWLAVAVGVIAFAAFLPTLQNGFVSWDDDKNFLGNTMYRGLGWTQLRWMWTTFHLGHYVPVTWMTLGLDYLLWGMDARGYHLTSLVLHAANASLLFFIARRLLLRSSVGGASGRIVSLGAAFAALVFAIHPLRVESVAWVTERRDVLSGCLMSLSVLVYLRAIDSSPRSQGRYWGAAALFLLALLSKATAMTLPAVLLLINVYPLKRLDLRAGLMSAAAKCVYAEIVPFAALSAAAMVLSLVALHPPEQLGLAQKIAVSAYGLTFYIWKTVAPVSLAPLYPLPLTVDATAPMFLLADGAVVALAALAWRLRRPAPGTVAALVGFGVLVLPMLGIVQNGPQIAADRYTYHASPALALLAGGAFVILWQRHRMVTAALTVSLLGTLGALTWKQTGIWRDSYSLWSHVLEVSDSSAIAHNSLGNVLMSHENVSQALAHFERAVQLDPDLPAAHDNLGVALAKLGRFSESVEQFSRAVALKPESDETHNNWGVVLSMQGDLPGAINHYRQAVALDPDNANAETNWGNALVRLDSLNVAISHYQRAVQIQPQHAEAHANWGATLARLSRWSEASDQLAIALKLNPDDADTRAALERVTLKIQRRTPSGVSGKAP